MPKSKEEQTPKKKPYYEKKITLGRDKDGKLIRKSVYAKKQADLDRKAFNVRQEYLANSEKRPDCSYTFMAYARRWLKFEKAQLAYYTRRNYNQIIEKYLAPYLEELYFHEITLDDFQNIINELCDRPSMCSYLKLTIKQIYASAYDAGLISSIPNFKRLALPKKGKPDKRALTDDEKAAVFSSDFTDKEKAFVYILYFCGLRREECLALDVSALDFKNKLLKVRQTVTHTGSSTVVEKNAKNFYSLRSVPIPNAAVPFLKKYAACCRGLLFPSNKDPALPMTAGEVQVMWRHIIKKMADSAPTALTLTPHLFRHNYATTLYYSNLSCKKAAQLMGHANENMILKVYAHLDEEKENAFEKLNTVFG